MSRYGLGGVGYPQQGIYAGGVATYDGHPEPVPMYGPNDGPMGAFLDEIDDDGNAVISHGNCKSTVNLDKPLVGGGNYGLPCGHRVRINAQDLHQAVTMTLLRKQMFPTLVKAARSPGEE